LEFGIYLLFGAWNLEFQIKSTFLTEATIWVAGKASFGRYQQDKSFNA
jgi:hypothetical protein